MVAERKIMPSGGLMLTWYRVGVVHPALLTSGALTLVLTTLIVVKILHEYLMKINGIDL